VATFLHAIEGDRLRALYVSAIGLGLRQGELLALRWQDVDLESGRLNVRHSLTLDTRQLVEPKTDKSRRSLRLPSIVTEALRDHRRAQVEERLAAAARWKDRDYVFTTRTGGPWRGTCCGRCTSI
jgi:integrase